MEIGTIQQACSICAVGQLRVTATSSSNAQKGKSFTMLQCQVCESSYKYQEGLMSLVKIGQIDRIPQVVRN